MKKIAAALLLFILCFYCAFSQAEKTDGYTFQGIHWFSSPEETIQQLIDLGFINDITNKVNVERLYTTEGSFRNSYIAYNKENKKVPYQFCHSDETEPFTEKLQKLTIGSSTKIQFCKTIANQEINNIHFLFTAEPGNPQLVEIDIVFQKGNTAIYQALVAAYGNPVWKSKLNEPVWLDDNNMIITQNKNGRIVAFATLDGLALAESIKLQINPVNVNKEDTVF